MQPSAANAPPLLLVVPPDGTESVTLQDTQSASDTACALTVTHHDSGAVWVVKLVGEADLSTQTTLESALSRALSMKRDTVVVDVSRLTFCDATCACALLDANRAGRRLVVAGHTGIVSRVFQLLDPGQTIARHG